MSRLNCFKVLYSETLIASSVPDPFHLNFKPRYVSENKIFTYFRFIFPNYLGLHLYFFGFSLHSFPPIQLVIGFCLFILIVLCKVISLYFLILQCTMSIIYIYIYIYTHTHTLYIIYIYIHTI